MTELKKVDVVSAMKVSAALSAVIGLLMGLFMGLIWGSFASMFASAGGGTPTGLLPMMGTMGIVSVIVFPIMAAIGGAIYGLICAVLYNFIAGMWGGLEVELK